MSSLMRRPKAPRALSPSAAARSATLRRRAAAPRPTIGSPKYFARTIVLANFYCLANLSIFCYYLAMERTYIKDLKGHIGKEVLIKGWVDVRRDHGKLIFVDLRDMTEKVQMVVLPNHTEAHAAAGAIRNEWVLEVKGKVNARPEKWSIKTKPMVLLKLKFWKSRFCRQLKKFLLSLVLTSTLIRI
jgi:lysyl-tRNA synthetase class II